MASPIMRFFRYEHLPLGPLRVASAECCAVAKRMDEALPDSAEKSAGLRKLLEAMDCFVRAAVPVAEEPAPSDDPAQTDVFMIHSHGALHHSHDNGHIPHIHWHGSIVFVDKNHPNAQDYSND